MNGYKNIRALFAYLVVCIFLITSMQAIIAADAQEVESTPESEQLITNKDQEMQSENQQQEVAPEEIQQETKETEEKSDQQKNEQNSGTVQPEEQKEELGQQKNEYESQQAEQIKNQKNQPQIIAQEKNKTTQHDVEKAIKKIDNPVAKKIKKNKNNDNTIAIQYEDEDLVNIINFFASKQGVNIMLPQGGNAIKVKVTFKLEDEVTIDRAWNELLPTILDVAGLSIVPKEDMFVVIKNNKDIVREPMPIYIGTDAKDLPSTDQRIRYLYYLANIKVTESSESEFSTILKEIMPEDILYKTDAASNSLFIVAKSSDIKGVMEIIEQLDQIGFQEKIEIIPLRHSSARIVADMFNEKILKPSSELNRYRLDTRKKPEANYFSPYVKLIADERTNSLIILGRTQAVDRVLEFIEQYIDVEIESGKSILHVYQLQYLDAKEFASTLQKIVDSTRSGGTGQSKGAKNSGGSTERIFDDIVIIADRPSDAEALNYYGGNKLVVAARNDDWREIKQLIEDLDTPQPQVLIEVLIADLTVDDQRTLGNILRNPVKIPLPADINFQSASYAGVVTENLGGFETIQADLLRGDALLGPPPTSIPATLAAGNAVLSLSDNDGRTWSLLRIVQSFTHTKILSHPHVIATNNQIAEVVIGETRLLPDEAGGTSGGAAVQKFKPITANLKINMKPRISPVGENSNKKGIVNMQVNIDISEFLLGNSNNARNSRVVQTNANIADGSILAIGGLIRTADTGGVSETPLLCKIPILGWFFKTRTSDLTETNLTVFILPTIIEPRLRRGIGEYTQDYIDATKSYVKEGVLFDTLRDPVTRWLFKSTDQISSAIDDFVSVDEFKEVEAHEHKKPKREAQVMRQKKGRHSDKDRHSNKVKMAQVERSEKKSYKKDNAQHFKQQLKQDENPFKVAEPKAAHLQS